MGALDKIEVVEVVTTSPVSSQDNAVFVPHIVEFDDEGDTLVDDGGEAHFDAAVVLTMAPAVAEFVSVSALDAGSRDITTSPLPVLDDSNLFTTATTTTDDVVSYHPETSVALDSDVTLVHGPSYAQDVQDTPSKPTVVSDFSDPSSSTSTAFAASVEAQPAKKKKVHRHGRGGAKRRSGKEPEREASDATPDPVSTPIPVSAGVSEVAPARDERGDEDVEEGQRKKRMTRRGGMSARFAKQRARAALAASEEPIAGPPPVFIRAAASRNLRVVLARYFNSVDAVPA